MASITPTLVRVKRKLTEEPTDVLVLSAKRLKSSDPGSSDFIFLWTPFPPSLVFPRFFPLFRSNYFPVSCHIVSRVKVQWNSTTELQPGTIKSLNKIFISSAADASIKILKLAGTITTDDEASLEESVSKILNGGRKHAPNFAALKVRSPFPLARQF